MTPLYLQPIEIAFLIAIAFVVVTIILGLLSLHQRQDR